MQPNNNRVIKWTFEYLGSLVEAKYTRILHIVYSIKCDIIMYMNNLLWRTL